MVTEVVSRQRYQSYLGRTRATLNLLLNPDFFIFDENLGQNSGDLANICPYEAHQLDELITSVDLSDQLINRSTEISDLRSQNGL